MANNSIRYDVGADLTDEMLDTLEKKVEKIYGDAAKDMQKTIDEFMADYKDKETILEKALKDGTYPKLTGMNANMTPEEHFKQWKLNQIARGQRYEAMRDKLAERMYNANRVAKRYENDNTPSVYSLNRNYSAYCIDKLTSGIDLTLFDEQTVKRLITKAPRTMPNYPKEKAISRGIDLAYSKKVIGNTITSAILQGRTIKQISETLQDRLFTMGRVSAVRSARTSWTSAQNGGRLDAMLEAQDRGIGIKKQWMATHDARTRDTHAFIDGDRKELKEEFPNGLMFPADPNGRPEEVYNCRCTILTIVNGKSVYKDGINLSKEDFEEFCNDRGVYIAKQAAKTPKYADGVIAGVSKGDPMTWDEADNYKTNPKYGTSRGYSINCQTCVPTFEARLRGYDVIAKANSGKRGSYLYELSRDTSKIWIDPATGKKPEYITNHLLQNADDLLKFVKDTVVQGGRYSIQFVWKGGGGHIVNLDRTPDGKIRIKDNQRGKDEKSEWIGDKEVRNYFDRFQYYGNNKSYGKGWAEQCNPKMLRLDKLDFNFEFASQVMTKAPKKRKK